MTTTMGGDMSRTSLLLSAIAIWAAGCTSGPTDPGEPLEARVGTVTGGLSCGSSNPSSCVGRASAKRKAAQQQCQALHGQDRGVCETFAANQFQSDVASCQIEGCLPAEHCCDDVCVPVSDANCEGCGLACTGGRTCEPDLNLSEGGHCACAPGDQFCGGSCVSTTCAVAGQGFNPDPNVCSCECAGGTVPCGGQCVSNSCANGFDTGSCGCCPAGTVLCGGACTSNVCVGAQAFDAASCSCQCPSTVACAGGQSFDTASCSCVPAGIQVLSASYGSGNCGEPVGNVTGAVAGECDGRTDCTVLVDNSVFGDPAFGCPKDFTVEWQCGQDPTVRMASHGPVAGEGYTVPLSCM